MNRYLSAFILAMLSGLGIHAQQMLRAPRLVVNITIDQLRTDYIERFAALYGTGGFKKLFSEGKVYKQASYSFSPLDRSSAVAALSTGTSPLYNGIVANNWLNRKSLKIESSVDDVKYHTSPSFIATTTLADELKIASAGSALVYSVAKDRDAAVLSVGHAADGALWLDEKTKKWRTSDYYPLSIQKWIKAFNSLLGGKQETKDNDNVTHLALECLDGNAIGRDEITDYLAITLSASNEVAQQEKNGFEGVYIGLDRVLTRLIQHIENKIGRDKVLFVLTGTGYDTENAIDYSKYRIPTGTFYINRTASLLNMFLSAVYGQGKYVDAYYNNQIYLNRKFIEDKRLSLDEVYNKSKDFLKQNAGVVDVHKSAYPTSVSGDIILDITPGWRLLNEDTHHSVVSRLSFVPFPIIFYGLNLKPEQVKERVLVEHIAPTIANAIHIRAPNACALAPLF